MSLRPGGLNPSNLVEKIAEALGEPVLDMERILLSDEVPWSLIKDRFGAHLNADSPLLLLCDEAQNMNAKSESLKTFLDSLPSGDEGPSPIPLVPVFAGLSDTTERIVRCPVHIRNAQGGARRTALPPVPGPAHSTVEDRLRVVRAPRRPSERGALCGLGLARRRRACGLPVRRTVLRRTRKGVSPLAGGRRGVRILGCRRHSRAQRQGHIPKQSGDLLRTADCEERSRGSQPRASRPHLNAHRKIRAGDQPAQTGRRPASRVREADERSGCGATGEGEE